MPDEHPDQSPSDAEGRPTPARRFSIAPGDLLNVLQPAAAEPEPGEYEQEDPYNAVGRTVARVNLEDQLATLYLTFDDGTYLLYAARIDEEGVILLDRFCAEPAEYGDYFVFDDLEGESGPPPEEAAAEPGSAFDPATWQQLAGRTVYDLGWFEEGMQSFVHFDDGAYLTVAARGATGTAYLAGYFSAEPPDEDAGEEYVIFPLPEGDDDGAGLNG